MGAFGKRIPQRPRRGQRNADFDSRTLSRRGRHLAGATNLRGALLHVFQSPVANFAKALLQIESPAVVGNRERQGSGAVIQTDSNLAGARMAIRVVGGLLSDA